jgi:hypothetical protein
VWRTATKKLWRRKIGSVTIPGEATRRGKVVVAEHPLQIASEALEIALQELEDRLPSASPATDNEAFPIEAAMAFITHHTPPA